MKAKTDSKYVVIVNMGGGLWDRVVEVKRRSEWPEYWSDAKGDVSWSVGSKPPNRDGCVYTVFDTKHEAQVFLDGARCFRSFMSRYCK
jgi:hypothetical protein